MIFFKDGEYVEEQQMKLSVNDRGYVFGDGVYEVVKVYDGALYTAEEHFTRLLESAEQIRIAIPYTVEELVELAKGLVQVNELKTGHVYLQVTRGVAPRVHQFPAADVEPVMIGYTVENARPLEALANGASLKTTDDVRWLRCNIKSLNLLGNVLAKQQAAEAGCQEALFIRDGFVTEGASSNMFGIRGGALYTHPANHLILNGITRRVVIGLAKELGMEVIEKPFTLDEALSMDEFFYTSTNSEITPVVAIDGKALSKGVPGEATRKLQQAFEAQLPSAVPAGEVTNGAAY